MTDPSTSRRMPPAPDGFATWLDYAVAKSSLTAMTCTQRSCANSIRCAKPHEWLTRSRRYRPDQNTTEWA